MRNLSLSEFKKICDVNSLSTFIFSTSNQLWNTVSNTLHAELCFTNLFIGFNPNTICMKDSTNNNISLHRVKTIHLCEKESLLGMVFKVTCGDLSSGNDDLEYTIIAR